eukprot:8151509-Alexandrium_andersonii.AAC.1
MGHVVDALERSPTRARAPLASARCWRPSSPCRCRGSRCPAWASAAPRARAHACGSDGCLGRCSSCAPEH